MKISIITTTYNRKEFLVQAIESVQQTVMAPYSDISIEHIIYDDGSTDGTKKLFEENRWKNTFFFQGKTNKGQSFGKNFAIQKADGDFIFMLDSDDIILQRTLYNFMKELKENSKTNFFVSDFLRVNENLQYIIGNDYYGWQFENKEDILNSIFKGEHFLQNNTFFRKNIFLEAGMFDEKLHMAEDLDLYIRFILNNHQPKYCNFVSHLHRYHSENLSLGVTVKEHKKDLEVLKNKYGIK